MTVKLLQAYDGYKANYLYSSDCATEERLLLWGFASEDLTGGSKIVHQGPLSTMVVNSPDIESLEYLGRSVLVQDQTGVQYLWDGSKYALPGEGAVPDLTNPMLDIGDMIAGGVAGAPTRLATPGEGSFTLQCIDGNLTWVENTP